MKERPILFNAEMVRAILDGRKTQTRRVMKPQPRDGSLSMFWKKHAWFKGDSITCSPYGKVGNQLWVRETFMPVPEGDGKWMVNYFASGSHASREHLDAPGYAPMLPHSGESYKPSIHMPRWASRINLKITSIKAERVQGISWTDAINEGIERRDKNFCIWYKDYSKPKKGFSNLPVDSFRTLWDSINAKRGYGWDANPWVWVVEFEVIA